MGSCGAILSSVLTTLKGLGWDVQWQKRFMELLWHRESNERRFHLGKDHRMGFCTGNDCDVMWIVVLSVPGMLSDVLAGGAWSQVCAGLDVALGAQFCQKKNLLWAGSRAG